MASKVRLGTMVGHYRLDSIMGRGGFGTVYAATDTRSESRVALKLLHAELVMEKSHLERFRREAEVTHRAGNPHIVRVLDSSFEGPDQYIVFELLEGETLRELMLEGPILATEAVDIVVDILDGLALAHSAGVIHRDIKPANIFLVPNPDGGGVQAKILDFGIGRLTEGSDQGLTRTGTALGTPYFMAPEQLIDSKRVDGRADLYSVAATLFLMLSDEPPYGRLNPAQWHEKLTKRAVPDRCVSKIEKLPEALVEAIAMGLEIDPDRRFLNAGAFARALLDAVPDSNAETRVLPALADSDSFSKRPPPPTQRQKLHFDLTTLRPAKGAKAASFAVGGTILALFLLIGVAAAVYTFWPSPPETAHATEVAIANGFCVSIDARGVPRCIPPRGLNECDVGSRFERECPPAPSAPAVVAPPPLPEAPAPRGRTAKRTRTSTREPHSAQRVDVWRSDEIEVEPEQPPAPTPPAPREVAPAPEPPTPTPTLTPPPPPTPAPRRGREDIEDPWGD